MLKKKIKFTLLDLFLLTGLGLLGVYVFLKVKNNLNYNWDWQFIFHYLFFIDPATGKIQSNYLLQGFFTTIKLSLFTTLLATLMGSVLGLMRISPSFLKKSLSTFYVQSIRNLPPLVVLFIFYFFIGDQIFPLFSLENTILKLSPSTQKILNFLFVPPEQITSFLSALLAMSIYEGAYIAEIVKGGLNSIPKGQWEAAASLGFSYSQQLRMVIFPQAFSKILPPLAGQFISIIKDSSIVSVISIQELTFQGMELMSSTYKTFEIWITITLLYFLLTYSLSWILGKLELRQNQSSFFVE
jgi:polar amino acid transport system permease protein